MKFIFFNIPKFDPLLEKTCPNRFLCANLCGLFDRLDTDKSGVIEADELKNALRAVGQHPM